MAVLTLLYLVIAARLWKEQVLSVSEYDSAIDKQTIRRIRQPAVRGRIITSDNKVLADNVPVYNIVFDLSNMRQPGKAQNTINYIVAAAKRVAETINRENPLKYDILFVFKKMHDGDPNYILEKAYQFAKILHRPPTLHRSLIEKYIKKYPKRAYTVFEDLSTADYEKIKPEIKKIPGVILTENSITNQITYHPALPMTVFKNLSEEELAKVEEISPHINGMDIITLPQRRYKYGTTACHLLGYIRKDDPREAEDRKKYFYYIPDKKGKNGIEKVYDTSIKNGDIEIRGLRGSPGNSLVKVDFRGYVYETIGNPIQAQRGHDIILTLNFEAQQIAEKLMRGKRGAFVLLDADTGAVLAMVSSPGYDLSQFTPHLSPAYYHKLQNDPGKPLFNRALLGVYEPGSIIKPIVSLALLNNGMPPDETVFCGGRSYVGDAQIKCASWRHGGHGPVNVVTALKQSCNVFFIEQGRILGLEKIAEVFDSVGVGKKTEFDLPNATGLLPSRAGKYNRTKIKWNTYDTALISIGQGEIGVTPLQAALFTALIANGGTLWKPYILESVKDETGHIIFINKPHARAELAIPPETLKMIHKGMYEVVHGVNGSGIRGNATTIKLYGKTGTAQKGKRGSMRQNTWFTCFGTHNNKKYALTVFVEDGASGGRTCAPIAKQFFDTWLKK